jgi:hypothetical protein
MSSSRDRTDGGDDVATTRVTYHEGTDTYRTEFDSHTRLATEAVVLAVAAASDRDPLALPVLADILDPDAINALVDVSAWNPADSTVALAFEYAGHDVTVTGRGTVTVTATDAPGGPTG